MMQTRNTPFVPTHSETMTPAEKEVHLRLLRWARWSLANGGKGRCRSIEHRYLPDPEELEPEVEPLPPPGVQMPSTREALATEKAVVKLPVVERRLITLRYLERLDLDELARAMHYSVTRAMDNLRTARLMVGNRVRFEA